MLKQEDGKWLLSAPVADEDVMQLKAGERVFISGKIYTGRDAAHKRLIEALNRGRPLPLTFKVKSFTMLGLAPPSLVRLSGPVGLRPATGWTPTPRF